MPIRLSFAMLCAALLLGGACRSSGRVVPKPEASLLHDAPRLMHGVSALEGLLPKPIRALSLRIKPNRILLQVQSKTQTFRVDQYRFKDGSILGPIAVELRGEGKLSDNLFPLSYADLRSLPTLIGQAERRAGLSSARAVEVLLQRNLPKSMDIQFLVTVRGAQGSRVVVARKDGRILSVRPGLRVGSTAHVTLPGG